ncbi:MAG: hypothetical protein ACR2ML_01085, partial [Solirubrobacteraceae bacterium]
MRNLARGITNGRATAVSAARSATRAIAAQLQGGAFAGGSVRMQRDPRGALIPQGSGRGATNLRGLANQISSTSRTATSEVTRLLANIRRQITQGMRSGATGPAMQGLRRAATVVTAEFTRRTKALTDRLKEQTAGLKRGRTAIERGLRRQGVPVASQQGYEAMRAYTATVVTKLEEQALAIRKAMMQARRTGSQELAAKLRKQLLAIRNELEETITKMVEDARRAAAGDFGQNAEGAGDYAETAEPEEKEEREDERDQEREDAKREKEDAERELRESEAEAQRELATAIQELKNEIEENSRVVKGVMATEHRVMLRAFADMFSREIVGDRLSGRSMSAGIGAVARS